MRRLLLIALLLTSGPPVVACAQVAGATLTGTVRDAETGAPLPGVNVFLAETTLGTATDTSGRFVLRGVPLGRHRLYVSRVGYEAAWRDTLLTQTDPLDPYTLAFRLEPAVVEMPGVTVEAERDRTWRRRFERFRRHFVGTGAHAEKTRILNPEVLRFDTAWWGKLEAEAARALLVENRALGYRIRYFLTEFETTGTRTRWDGEPLFEKMTPEDSAQAARWRANRRRAYLGSLRHFLRALRAGDARAAGFAITMRRPQMARFGAYASSGRPFSRERHLRPDSPGEGQTMGLHFWGQMVILYLKEEADPAFARSRYRLRDHPPGTQASMLELEDGDVTIDRTGEFVEPYDAIQFGYFAFERLAGQVPREYRLEE